MSKTVRIIFHAFIHSIRSSLFVHITRRINRHRDKAYAVPMNDDITISSHLCPLHLNFFYSQFLSRFVYMCIHLCSISTDDLSWTYDENFLSYRRDQSTLKDYAKKELDIFINSCIKKMPDFFLFTDVNSPQPYEKL